jgi:serine/threonine-protein kinase RsbW
VDWLIDPGDPRHLDRVTGLLGEHLSRHAADPDAVERALSDAREPLEDALAPRTKLVRVRLDWSAATPVVELHPLVSDTTAPAGVRPHQPVPLRRRGVLDELLGERITSLSLPVDRRAQETFPAGPPPTPVIDVDPRRDGPAAVAVALVAAMDAHPSASGPQAATLAGAILAHAGAAGRETLRPDEAADLLQGLHRALGSDAVVELVGEDVIEMSVTHCPFGPGIAGAPSMGHVTAGLAGQLGARVHGEATVLLDESIAAGDPECHLQMLLRPDREDRRAQRHRWPATAAPEVAPAPYFDLALSLPRESGSVPVVRRLAAQALRAFGVEDEDIDDVQMAITEACANVVEHATETDSYEVKVELAADRCAITVVDQGSGFDATASGDEPIDLPSPTEESGRGLMLMQALVDKIAFQCEPRAGAVVHMVKRLNFDGDHPLWRANVPPGASRPAG